MKFAGTAALVLSACLLTWCSVAAAQTVSYRGYNVRVPNGWPVFRISAGSHECVRFNRHAVYLGVPGNDQLCPTAALGRTEAILVQPLTGSVPPVSAGGSIVRIIDRARGVLVTASWRTDPAVIRQALGLRTLASSAAAVASPASQVAARSLPRSGGGTGLGGSTTPGTVYNGLGFDTCSTPSVATMTAWKSSSPFGAVGVYIGGVNAACDNLTSSWVTTESAAGWALMPIYVGLQAPGSSCGGCSQIVAASAAAEGTAAAADAVVQAQAVGIGTGNPIYNDMEAYTPSAKNTKAVLTFLSAWTTELHLKGYLSGVYSSDASGITDLASAFGGGVYKEPDDIWFANWNNEANVTDSTAPTADWPAGRRLHQYSSGNAKYGGITLDIDRNDVDGQTAVGASSGTTASAPPVASTAPSVGGTPVVGQSVVEGHARWSGQPTSYAYQWELCNSAGADCTAIAGATGRRYTVPKADAGMSLEVVESATNAAGTGTAGPSLSSATIATTTAGYFLFSGTGNVYNSLYEPFYGSPPSRGHVVSSVVGLATTRDGHGYWMVTSAGAIWRYGDARGFPAIRPAHPVAGIVASSTGGYWLYTANGNVYNSRGTYWYGSPASQHIQTTSIVGMAMVAGGDGYWLVTARGKVRAYGYASVLPTATVKHTVRGIVASSTGGYWLYTANGNVYNSRGTAWYGSPASSGVRTDQITGMLATPDGKGYWVVTSTGTVYAYGDATAYPTITPTVPVLGF